VARRRFQTGQLYKKGKRRKVWIARWREDILLPDGTIGRMRRGILLGSVADLPTRRDAQVRLDERLRLINQGAVRPESIIGFGAFVEQQWKVLVLPTFKRTTQHGYQAVLRVHVLPTWQDAPLRDIDRLAIQQWVADRLRRGIGWQSVRNAWVLLSSILETAVEFGYLQSNPARGVKFPQKALKKKPAMIAGGDFAKLLEQLNETHRTMVSLIAATGLRIGELLALRWSSLDLEDGALTVRESVFEGKFQAPKTQRALRTIPLGPYAVKALKEHRDRLSRNGDDDLVFGNRKGDPLRESKLLTKVLQPAAKIAGLGRVTWHQFRHIHSSLLNDLNVPVKIAQEQLGHASIATTLNIYTHAVDASHRKAIEAVERELFVVLDRSGLQTAAGLENTPPASNSVN
jgi:integrase